MDPILRHVNTYTGDIFFVAVLMSRPNGGSCDRGLLETLNVKPQNGHIHEELPSGKLSHSYGTSPF